MFNKPLLVFTITSIAWTAYVSAQTSQIGIIDFYGNGVKESQLRKCLPFEENDSVTFLTESTYPIAKNQIIECLLDQPDIKQADLSFVCCDSRSAWILFVGVDTETKKEYRVAKGIDLELPVEMNVTYDSLMNQERIAAETGEVFEDDSRGHSLANYLPARRLQEKFIVYANRDLNLLRKVLRSATNPGQRERAAAIIAYHKDKSSIIDDLLRAVSDPHEGVRNNAIRAIGIIAEYAQQRHELKIKIPAAPFIDMMNSISWTDRNKSGFVLLKLTGNRDKKIIGELTKKAFKPIVDMANWKSDAHAIHGYTILGRMAQWTDKEIADGFANRPASVKRMIATIEK